jgi:nucleoside-diphosphate-sugar epimerase
MKILIIGGTGFIGPKVADRLVEKHNHDVTLFHRRQREGAIPEGANEILGNRNDLRTFGDQFKKIKPDVVLDMFPITRMDARTVVDIFTSCAGRHVSISSQDVYSAYGKLLNLETGPPDPVPLTESAPLRSKLYPYRGSTPREESDPARRMDDYDKILVEKAVMSASGLPGTVLRLPMVYGPGDNQHRLFDTIKRMDDGRKKIVLHEDMASWRWTRGYVEDVAEAIVLAVIDPVAENRIYNVGEPETLTMKEWIETIGRIDGWDGEVISVPGQLLPDEMQPGMNTDQHLTTDTNRIRTELGYKETVTLDEAVRRTIAWERQNPPAQINPDQFDYTAEDKILNSLNHG